MNGNRPKRDGLTILILGLCPHSPKSLCPHSPKSLCPHSPKSLCAVRTQPTGFVGSSP